MEISDFKNVTFENIPWASFEVTKVKGGCLVKEQGFEAKKSQIIRKN